MGMYDTVYFKCPKCGKQSTMQSKAGPCELKDYKLKKAPLSVLADVLYDSKHNNLYCSECSAELEFRVLVKTFLTAKDSDDNDTGWREG